MGLQSTTTTNCSFALSMKPGATQERRITAQCDGCDGQWAGNNRKLARASYIKCITMRTSVQQLGLQRVMSPCSMSTSMDSMDNGVTSASAFEWIPREATSP